MDNSVKEKIEKLIGSETVFLFMKGNPSFPQCGFSNQVNEILKGFQVPYGHCNILAEPDIRQGIKEYSDWPTIPQLYVKGEFVGGCDIVKEMWESGELLATFQDAFPDREIAAPKPPAPVNQITPAQAKELVVQEGVYFLDIRTPEEREMANVEGSQLLDQELAQNLIENVDRQTPLVCMCHFGGRSAQACEYLTNHGFQNVYNVKGGIDEWSKSVDESIPRY